MLLTTALTLLFSMTSFASVIQTKAILKNPESTTIINKQIFVTNIGEKNWKKKDGDGFISKFNLDGKVEKLKFTTGLNDPKGIFPFNNSLIVTDISEVVVINSISGKIIKKIPNGASFLNDIFVTDQGLALVTDTYDGKIYSVNLETEEVKSILTSMEEAPNGIYQKQGFLYIGSWANAISSPSLGNLDGVEPYKENSWLISDKTAGAIYIFDELSGKHQTIDHTFTDVADIHYSKKHGILVAPLMTSGELVIYPLPQ